MGRPSKGIDTVEMTIYVPVELRKRMDELLFNNEKGRVVKGSYNTFIISMLARELRANESKVKKLLEAENGGSN